MNRQMRVLGVLVLLVVAWGVAVLPQRGSSAAAQEPPPPPHAIMIEEKLCIALMIAVGHVDSTTAGLKCVDLTNPTSLEAVAGFMAMSNGADDPIYASDGSRVDQPCTADTNNDGVLCGPGDVGVDDQVEVVSQIDLRDDGVLDGKYTLRASDFAALDLDANQLHEFDGRLWVLVFDDGNDTPTRFRPSAGLVRVDTSLAGAKDFVCGSVNISNVSFFDEDCNNDGIAGDGVKVVSLGPGTPTPARGPETMRITEPHRETYVDYSIVGEIHSVTFTVLKGTAAANTAKKDCSFPLSVAGVTKALGDPHMAVVLVHALDSDGTQITSALLDWSFDDPDKAFAFVPTTPTVDLGGFGKGFPQAICGNKTTGVVKVTAKTSAQAATLDPSSNPDVHASFDVTIVGEAASIDVTATPAQLACDGTATTEISAKLLDAAGSLVANGTEVRFDVQVLGTATPLVAKTSDGIAKSVIAPLAPGATGVPVIITAGDVQVAYLVPCSSAGVPPAGGQPTGGTQGAGGGQTGTITGPNTGTGGVGAGSGSALSWWPLLALSAAAMALSTLRFALKRR